MKSKVLGLLAMALLLGAGSSKAAMVIDQNNPSHGDGFCFISTQNCGQSFQQSSANISGAGIFLSPDFSAEPGTVTISIYQSYGTPSTGLIATGTSGVVNKNSGWVDVFWTPVVISPATTYYMVLTGATPLVATADETNTQGGLYGLGHAVLYGDSGNNYGADLTFRTWYDAEPPAVPLPAAGWLMLSGLASLGFLGRRRKAA